MAVPLLNATKTVIYKADSMWWHCYIFQKFVLVAVYSGWDAGLGQVEFRGDTGGLAEQQRYRIRRLALMKGRYAERT